VSEPRFWEHKSLAEMSTQEWESLCDGCAKCCLHKLEDEDDGEVFYTNIRCRYLAEDTCRCSDYDRRSVLVPHCIKLRAEDLADYHWLPVTCAYRLLAQGRPLEPWHPLLSGSPDSVHEAGVSIRGRAISDEFVHPDGYDEHIVHWQE
jgi:uncharacterized cysteine cluster protein YcgN (CxxCxxCC family)